MSKLQRWIRMMKKTEPSEFLSGALPEITDADRNKVLVVDSDKNTTWGDVAGGGIPLGDGEGIFIYKEPQNS